MGRSVEGGHEADHEAGDRRLAVEGFQSGLEVHMRHISYVYRCTDRPQPLQS